MHLPDRPRAPSFTATIQLQSSPQGAYTLLSCSAEKKLFPEEPPEPKTGTARTEPPPNRNRSEPGPPCNEHAIFERSLCVQMRKARGLSEVLLAHLNFWRLRRQLRMYACHHCVEAWHLW